MASRAVFSYLYELMNSRNREINVFTRIKATARIQYFTPQVWRSFKGGAYLQSGQDNESYILYLYQNFTVCCHYYSLLYSPLPDLSLRTSAVLKSLCSGFLGIRNSSNKRRIATSALINFLSQMRRLFEGGAYSSRYGTHNTFRDCPVYF